MTDDIPISPLARQTTGAPRVVVFDPIPGGWSFERERWILARQGVELVVPASPADADAAIRAADVVIVTGVRRLDAEAVTSLRRAVGIQCYSIGMDKVDAAAAASAGIAVHNVPDYCTDEVSDHAMALLLAAERRLVPVVHATAGQWRLTDRAVLAPIRRLRGQTLGILGVGRIGRLVARKARAFGFVTIAYDPFVHASVEPELELVPFDDLMARSDALVLCAALTPASRGIIGREALARARHGLIIVNVARGGLIDEAALAEGLGDGRVGYAALDVRDPEPPNPADDPLRDLAGVLQTPHVAATSQEAAQELHESAAESVLRILEAAGRIAPDERDAATAPGA
jgi:D-3-phosphoglycerate dehydrogenase